MTKRSEVDNQVVLQVMLYIMPQPWLDANMAALQVNANEIPTLVVHLIPNLSYSACLCTFLARPL